MDLFSGAQFHTIAYSMIHWVQLLHTRRTVEEDFRAPEEVTCGLLQWRGETLRPHAPVESIEPVMAAFQVSYGRSAMDRRTR